MPITQNKTCIMKIKLSDVCYSLHRMVFIKKQNLFWLIVWLPKTRGRHARSLNLLFKFLLLFGFPFLLFYLTWIQSSLEKARRSFHQIAHFHQSSSHPDSKLFEVFKVIKKLIFKKKKCFLLNILLHFSLYCTFKVENENLGDEYDIV